MKQVFDPVKTKKKLVLLIHGIRTRALWQHRIKDMLGNKNTIIEPIGYDYFNLFEFLCPLYTRKEAVNSIYYKINNAIEKHHDYDELIIIAHSFGTYCLSKILKENPLIKPSRIILCGSVIDNKFNWRSITQKTTVLNECGLKDIWPCLARSFTWGYGNTGTFGFKDPCVEDRFHDNSHSDYFKTEFINKFWKPFIANGQIVKSDTKVVEKEPSLFFSILSFRPFRLPVLGWLLVCLFITISIKADLFSLFSQEEKPIWTDATKGMPNINRTINQLIKNPNADKKRIMEELIKLKRPSNDLINLMLDAEKNPKEKINRPQNLVSLYLYLSMAYYQLAEISQYGLIDIKSDNTDLISEAITNAEKAVVYAEKGLDFHETIFSSYDALPSKISELWSETKFIETFARITETSAEWQMTLF